MTNRVGQYGKHRFFEILPGFLIWLTFSLAILSSFFAPSIAVIFIIIFDLYWTLRVLYFMIYVIVSYKNYRQTLKTDWDQAIKKLDHWQDIYHVVMLPTFQEDLSIIQTAMRALLESTYQNDRFIVVVGGEQADEVNFNKYIEPLRQEFEGKFQKLMFTIHPKGLPGEIPGKGSNMKWMGEQLKKEIDQMNISYKNIIVSAFDVDTIAHKQYFSHLTYLYLTEPEPTRSSYQPIVLFSNNIWQATAPVRIAAFGTTFWLMAEQVRPERMWTFSSHSMPWQMLVDVGFWEPDLVSEDSRIFMQGFLHYEGKYRVTPVFLPVYMDAVTGKNYFESLVALYKQQRRWAWGVEHLPYIVDNFRRQPNISRRTKLKYIFNHMEGMFTWATAPVLIFLLGYLPFFVTKNAPTALVANSPFTLEWMMRIATAGVFFSALLSLFLLPKRPQKVKPWGWLVMLAQWCLLPITFTVFGAMPAIDAQTRFMLGKYLGFNVTKKTR
ncbi:MAG: hypothetical protein ABH846_02830 [Patescibacteria group bacterium]